MIPLPLKQGLKLRDGSEAYRRVSAVMIPLPLKQGLKPSVPWQSRTPGNVMIPLPLKQGLKLFGVCSGWVSSGVMIPLPLKQGLKLPLGAPPRPPRKTVMIPLPLKQGLKHRLCLSVGTNSDCYDSTSTKTRIETSGNRYNDVFERLVMIPLPLKQGLKRIPPVSLRSVSQSVMIPLPLKQGLKHCSICRFSCVG